MRVGCIIIAGAGATSSRLRGDFLTPLRLGGVSPPEPNADVEQYNPKVFDDFSYRQDMPLEEVLSQQAERESLHQALMSTGNQIVRTQRLDDFAPDDVQNAENVLQDAAKDSKPANIADAEDDIQAAAANLGMGKMDLAVPTPPPAPAPKPIPPQKTETTSKAPTAAQPAETTSSTTSKVTIVNKPNAKPTSQSADTAPTTAAAVQETTSAAPVTPAKTSTASSTATATTETSTTASVTVQDLPSIITVTDGDDDVASATSTAAATKTATTASNTEAPTAKSTKAQSVTDDTATSTPDALAGILSVTDASSDLSTTATTSTVTDADAPAAASATHSPSSTVTSTPADNSDVIASALSSTIAQSLTSTSTETPVPSLVSTLDLNSILGNDVNGATTSSTSAGPSMEDILAQLNQPLASTASTTSQAPVTSKAAEPAVSSDKKADTTAGASQTSATTAASSSSTSQEEQVAKSTKDELTKAQQKSKDSSAQKKKAQKAYDDAQKGMVAAMSTKTNKKQAIKDAQAKLEQAADDVEKAEQDHDEATKSVETARTAAKSADANLASKRKQVAAQKLKNIETEKTAQPKKKSTAVESSISKATSKKKESGVHVKVIYNEKQSSSDSVDSKYEVPKGPVKHADPKNPYKSNEPDSDEEQPATTTKPPPKKKPPTTPVPIIEDDDDDDDKPFDKPAAAKTTPKPKEESDESTSESQDDTATTTKKQITKKPLMEDSDSSDEDMNKVIAQLQATIHTGKKSSSNEKEQLTVKVNEKLTSKDAKKSEDGPLSTTVVEYIKSDNPSKLDASVSATATKPPKRSFFRSDQSATEKKSVASKSDLIIKPSLPKETTISKDTSSKSKAKPEPTPSKSRTLRRAQSDPEPSSESGVFSKDDSPKKYPNIKTVESGKPGTKSYRMYFQTKNGDPISPWHDIPTCHQKSANGKHCEIYNGIVEVPKDTKKKFEMRLQETHNPVAQDTIDNKLREYKGPIYWNYGFIPQTWQDDTITRKMNVTSEDDITHERQITADGDPIDFVVVGTNVNKVGDIIQFRVLGALPLVHNDQLDWKMIVADVNDDFYKDTKTLQELHKQSPTIIPLIHQWFTWYQYEKAEEKSLNKYANGGEPVDELQANKVVKQAHARYNKLIEDYWTADKKYKQAEQDFTNARKSFSQKHAAHTNAQDSLAKASDIAVSAENAFIVANKTKAAATETHAAAKLALEKAKRGYFFSNSTL